MPGGGGEGLHTVLTDAPRSPGRDGGRLHGGGVPHGRRRRELVAVQLRCVSAVFLPDPNPEFGQCVHKVARDAADPDRLYLQNHWGVYRSDDAGGALDRHRHGSADHVRIRGGRTPPPG
ncbi:hypothetical protein GCM10017687_67530 [Streptomyces echinatus]